MNLAKFAVAGVFVLGTVGPLSAQTSSELNTQITTMDSLAGSQGGGKVVSKISNDFSSFLGSSDSTAVVTGLRNGTPINLTRTTTSTATGAPTATTTTTTINTINPRGYGEVYISLALAKQQLANLGIGITEPPTPAELQAVLNGGTVKSAAGTETTTLDGILTMRESGMGYGQIAQSMDTKLGHVISSMKRANQSFASTSSSETNVTNTASTTSSQTRGKGIVSAGGKSSNVSTGGSSKGQGGKSGIVTGSGQSMGGHGHAYGKGSQSGIVTGSGNSVSHGNGLAHGKGGIVSGAGSSIGASSGIVSGGGGQGMGQARGKGHNK